MTRQIRLLTRLSMYGMFGLNEFFHTRDVRKKRRYYLFGVLWAFLIVMLAGYVCALSYGLIAMGLRKLVPAALSVSVSLLIFFFTIFKAGPVLFDRKAYEKQIAMPVTVRAIIVSRFLSMYITSMLLGFLVLLPGMAVCGVLENPGVTFWIYGIGAGIFLPLLPLTLASIVGALIAGISSRWKRKNLISIVLTIGFVCVIMIGSMRMSTMEESELIGMMEQMAEQMEGQIRSIYPPAMWIADAMVEGEATSFSLFLAVSLGSFLLFLEILRHFYVNICMLLGAREAKGKYRMEVLRKKSVLRTMVERELRHYFSSTIYVTNTLMGEILMLIVAIAVLVTGPETVEAMLGLPGVVSRMLPLLVGFLPAMMPLTACSISMEGKQWWMLQTLPVTEKDVIRSKVVTKLLVSLPFYLVSEVLLLIALRPADVDALCLLAVPAVYIVFGARAGLAINSKFPLFDWENEVRVVKQSASTMLTMLVSLVSVLVPAAALLVCPDIPAAVVYAVTIVLLAAAVWGMDRKTVLP